MPVKKVCAYELCSKMFLTENIHKRFCSPACGNAARTVESHDAIRTYLMQHVDIFQSPSQCWEWRGSINTNGYGMAFVKKQSIRAHRLMYEIFVAPIPEGKDILHSQECTTRACVNFHHLRPGTTKQNMEDKIAVGRQKRGSAHYASRLTEQDAADALAWYHEQHWTYQKIADMLSERYPDAEKKISFVTVSDIINRVTWAHVLCDQYPASPKDKRYTLGPADLEKILELHTRFRMRYPQIAEMFHVTPDYIGTICRAAKTAVQENLPGMMAYTEITTDVVRRLRYLHEEEHHSFTRLARDQRLKRATVVAICTYRIHKDVA